MCQRNRRGHDDRPMGLQLHRPHVIEHDRDPAASLIQQRAHHLAHLVMGVHLLRCHLDPFNHRAGRRWRHGVP